MTLMDFKWSLDDLSGEGIRAEESEGGGRTGLAFQVSDAFPRLFV